MDQAIQCGPAHADYYCEKASSLLALNQPDQAMRLIEQAQAIHPDHGRAKSLKETIIAAMP